MIRVNVFTETLTENLQTFTSLSRRPITYTRDTRENLISIHVLLKFPDVNSLRPSFLRTLFSFFLPFFLSQACLDYTGSLEGWMPRQSLKHLR